MNKLLPDVPFEQLSIGMLVRSTNTDMLGFISGLWEKAPCDDDHKVAISYTYGTVGPKVQHQHLWGVEVLFEYREDDVDGYTNAEVDILNAILSTKLEMRLELTSPLQDIVDNWAEWIKLPQLEQKHHLCTLIKNLKDKHV